jgi:hypothetical protein
VIQRHQVSAIRDEHDAGEFPVAIAVTHGCERAGQIGIACGCGQPRHIGALHPITGLQDLDGEGARQCGHELVSHDSLGACETCDASLLQAHAAGRVDQERDHTAAPRRRCKRYDGPQQEEHQEAQRGEAKAHQRCALPTA